jgi:hypothetical protein
MQCITKLATSESKKSPLSPQNYNTEYTDKKENKTFLITKEIQTGAFANSYITNGANI